MAVLAADVATGPAIMFPAFFIIPVTLSAWYSSRRLAMALSVLLPVGRAFIATDIEAIHSAPIAMINCAIRIAVFVFIAYLVSRTRRQTLALQRRVNLLEGILPICMFCKRIRDDEHHHWEQIESYVAERSQAKFSHGVCPECEAKYLKELLNDSPK
ncbi:MAG: DUF4118 domain-containing protein [Verrucomicrobiales bacterium]|nr:DUF4118 domain-containing protein [Verrucomicrobiales bacterium]